jgi:hypothetical protein
MESAWAQPLVLRRWERAALRLTEAQCERIVEVTVRRGLAGAELRCLTLEQATEGWAMETCGLAMAATARAPMQPRPAFPPVVRASSPLAHVHQSQVSLAF